MFFTFFILYILPALAFLKKASKKNKFFYLLIISPLLTSIISLLLLFFNFFNFWIIFIIDLFLSIYGILNLKKFLFPVKGYLFPVLIALISLPFFLIHGEPFEGASDSGVYTSSALNLIEKGRYFLKYEEHLKEEFKEISIKETNYSYKWKETYPGIIFLKDKFVPQFFPLYPIHLGIFYKIFKIKGILFCNFYFFFLSLLVFYKLLNLFLGNFYSKISLLIFGLNPGVLYFTKYPTAEIFLTFLILSFIYFFLIFLKTGKKFFCVISSIFLCLSFTTKFLSYFLLGGLFLFYLFYEKKKKLNNFLIYLLIFSLIPIISIFLYNYPYLLNHLLPNIRLKYIFGIILFSLIILILKKIKFFKKFLFFFPLFFIIISIWALFLRTNINEIFEENNLLEFSWYAGLLTLNLSFLGSFFSFFKKKNLFLNINYYIFLILIIFGTGDNPLHPFSFRRYIPLFLPLTAFYFSYLLKNLNIKKFFSIFILILCLIYPAYKGKGLLFSKEGKGFLSLYFEGLSKEFPDKTFCTDDSFFLSSQLNLVGKKKIYPLNIEDRNVLLKFQEFLKKNEKFYLFSSFHFKFPKIFEIKGEIEHIQPERNKIPENIIFLKPEFFLYEIDEKEYKEYEIKIGENDFGRISNFWDLEFDGEKYFKWSKRETFFYIKLKNELILLIDKGGNPENPVPFRIYHNEEIIFEGFAKEGWNNYIFKVPENLKEKEVLLRFVTHSFQPLPDTRELGLKLSEILSK